MDLKRAHTLKNLYKRKNKKNHDDAEDFFQFVVLNMLRRDTDLANFDWLLADWLELKKKEQITTTVNMDIFEYQETEKKKEELIEAIEKKELKALDRAFLILLVKWGFTKREIAHVFGFSESYVGQRIKDVRW